MRKKDFYRIINEEISNFDFLGNDQRLKEQESVELIANEQFQKQFIIDSITNMRDKINIINSDAYVTDNDPEVQIEDYHNDLNIDVNVDLTYKRTPQDEPIELGLGFDGQNVSYGTDHHSERQTYDYPGSSETWYTYINWDSIEVNLYTKDGDELKFVAFDNAPRNIQHLFIRSYIEHEIEKGTELGDIKEKMPQLTKF